VTVLRIVVRGVLAHKLRLLLTTIAIVLGVAFITAALVYADTDRRVRGTAFDAAYSTVAFQVQADAPFSDAATGAAPLPPIPASLVDQLRAVPGVAGVHPVVTGYVAVVDPRGGVLGDAALPRIGANWPGRDGGPYSGVRFTQGGPPNGADEVAIEEGTAREGGLEAGDRVRILLPDRALDARLVGVFSLGDATALSGATLTLFDTGTAQRLLLEPGRFSAITLTAVRGVPDEELAERVRAVLPPGLEVLSGEQAAEQAAKPIGQASAVVQPLLILFAGVALFVGIFLIVNTFSILVAQRTRELGLLRVVGADRAQLRRLVLGESLVVGLVSSVIAVGVGIGLAALSRWAVFALALKQSGGPGGLVVAPRTPLVSILLGVVVTTAAAWWPARRAGRVPPLAALRDGTADERVSARRVALGLALMALSVVGFAAAFVVSGEGAAMLAGLSAILVVLAVSALSPQITPVVLRTVGVPLTRMFGVAGRLSSQNAARSPRRTAATAATLMVGLAVVTGLAVLAQSAKVSFDRVVKNTLAADVAVAAPFNLPFSTGVAERVRTLDGLGSMSELRIGVARIDGVSAQMDAVDPAAFPALVRMRVVEGSPAGLARGGLLVDQKTARSHGWRVGDALPVRFARAGTKRLTVAGVYERNALAGSYLISLDTYRENFSLNLDYAVYAKAAPGTDPSALYQRVGAALRDDPSVTVYRQRDFQQTLGQQVNLALGFTYGLLGMAILVAVLGIVNTLALSVIERTREIGLLRTVGMSRRQLRCMVRLESLIIAAYGGVLGVAVGLVFGVALRRALQDFSFGIDTLAVPVGQLLVFVILAALLGLAAATWPARRAARLDILRAITFE
jgi:putative ABC transport system permease protein